MLFNVKASPSSTQSTPVKDYALQRQRLFHEQSQKLLKFIQETQQLLEDLRQTNRNRFHVHYPTRFWCNGPTATSSSGQSAQPEESVQSLGTLSTASIGQIEPPPAAAVRKLTTGEAPVQQPSGMAESVSDMDLSSEVLGLGDNQEGLASTWSSGELRILKLDLRLAHRVASVDGTALVHSLEAASISNLFDEQLAQSLAHLSRLHARVADRTSKVLVTGDLNAGKSTLVNSLLRKDVVPWDQQPCTMLFCEVLDARENDGQPAIHAIPDAQVYDPRDTSTFVLIAPEDLDDVVMDNLDNYQQLKLYTVDGRDPSDSLLNNGVVDIALIDSPGLNRDSLKTTQLFTRQEEIDVIIFVVNSENHFTLSGQEFLTTAGKEKAYIFIVVNKFDTIRNKDRCRRLILEQIKELSPHTFANSHDLVHFVSAQNMYRSIPPSVSSTETLAEEAHVLAPEFMHLEQCLRSFTLEKRFISKLAPAQRYLLAVLDDVTLLSQANFSKAAQQVEAINQELKTAVPVYQTLLTQRQAASERANRLLDSSCELVRQTTIRRLTDQITRFTCATEAAGVGEERHPTTASPKALEQGNDNLGQESPSTELVVMAPDDIRVHVPWGGFLYTFQYIAQLKGFLLSRMEQELHQCELLTEEVVDKVTFQINDLHPHPMPRKPFHIPWDTIEDELATDSDRLTTDQMTDQDIVATLQRAQTTSTSNSTPQRVGTSPTLSCAALLDFSLAPSELLNFSFELDAVHLLGVASASLGTAAMVFSHLPLVSSGEMALRLLRWSSSCLGWRGLRHLTLLGATLMGAGCFIYLTADLDRNIRQRIVHRLREQITATGYIEHQSYILFHAANKAIRPFVWDVQSSYQGLIEHEERQRAQKLEKRFLAEESRDYFKSLIQKSTILQQLVSDVTATDDY